MANSKKKSSTSSAEENDQNQAASGTDLGEAVLEAGEQVQEQVSNLTDQVRQQVGEQVATQKDRLAETLETVALLLHQAGEHADLKDKAGLAGYVDKASTQVGQWSESLRERDASQLLDDTVQFARRQPMVFLSGALAAGFAGARFLRSSTQQPEQTSNGASDNGTGNGTDSGALDTSTYADEMPAFDADSTGGYGQSDIDAPLADSQDPYIVEDDVTAGLEGNPLIDSSMAGESDATSTEQR